MAYSKKNRLKRIIDIQNIYREKEALGVTPMNIYRLYIADQYRISESCFFNYLTIFAKKQLKELEEKDRLKKAQLKLF